MKTPSADQDDYSYPLHLQGSASTLPAPVEDDVIARLHAVVKEVTGKDVARTEKPKMGFLP